MRRPLRLFIGLLILGLCAIIQAEPDQPGILTIAPDPTWITPREWETSSVESYRGAPAVGLLFDTQTRLGPGPSQRYNHSVILLRNGEGVRRFAEFGISINPEYEHVRVHSLRIHRAGQIEDRLSATEFKTLQRETNIENQIYDGSRTFYAVLSDIRPGDILEQSYSIIGDHPLVAGRVGATHHIGGMIPLVAQFAETRQPMDQPELGVTWWHPPGTQGLPDSIYDSKSVQTRLTRADTAAERIWHWSARQLPAVPLEQNMSWRSSPILPYLRLTAFPEWDDVAEWGRSCFTAPTELPEELERLVISWQTDIPDRETRIAAAIRWVQDDIRYFAFAMGENNWRPRSIEAIAATRFGDCKDKSLLLATLLRRLGEYAWPALVNTHARASLDGISPSPYAFNHAIVALRDANGWRWTDPTLRLQRGPGSSWRIPDYGFALILAPGKQTLLPIIRPPLSDPDTILRDDIELTSEGHARIRHILVFRGEPADDMRRRLDSEPLTEIGLRWNHFIGRFYEGLEEVEEMEAHDDLPTGTITLRAEYIVRDVVQKNETGNLSFAAIAYAARMLFDPLDTTRRRWPIDTMGQRWVRHEIAVTTPFDLELQAIDEGMADKDVRYTVIAGSGDRRFRAVHDWQTLRDWVPATELTSYGETIRHLLRVCSLAAVATQSASAGD